MTEKMEQTRRGLVRYDVCEACGGIWFDRGEMDAMVVQWHPSVEDASRDETKDVSEPSVRCPRCENQMLNKVVFMNYSKIVLDHCRGCHGFWLDGGELDLINQDLRSLKGYTPPEGDGSPISLMDLLWMVSQLLELRHR